MKLTDIIKTGIDIVTTVITEDPVPPEVYEERKEICRACPNRNSKNTKCLLCGCDLRIKRNYLKYHCADDPARW